VIAASGRTIESVTAPQPTAALAAMWDHDQKLGIDPLAIERVPAPESLPPSRGLVIKPPPWSMFARETAPAPAVEVPVEDTEPRPAKRPGQRLGLSRAR
jgi:hypothetical protein